MPCAGMVCSYAERRFAKHGYCCPECFAAGTGQSFMRQQIPAEHIAGSQGCPVFNATRRALDRMEVKRRAIIHSKPDSLHEENGFERIVRKNLLWPNPGFKAQRFHLSPYIAPAFRLSAPGDKDRAAEDPVLPCVSEQLFPQDGRDIYPSVFSLIADFDPLLFQRLNRKIRQFADPDSRTRDCFHAQRKLMGFWCE